MNKWIKIILGLLILVLSLYLILPGMPLSHWGLAAWELIKGGITILVVLIGLILIVMGIEDLRN